jgi:K+ transporter
MVSFWAYLTGQRLLQVLVVVEVAMIAMDMLITPAVGVVEEVEAVPVREEKEGTVVTALLLKQIHRVAAEGEGGLAVL